MTLSNIGTQQATVTEQPKTAIVKLLNYVSTYPADEVTYQVSGRIHSHAAGQEVTSSYQKTIPSLNPMDQSYPFMSHEVCLRLSCRS